ncbi:hypothetical protein [Alteromonas sp. 4B03]
MDNKSLFKLYSFQLSIGIPFLISIFTALYIFLTSDLEYESGYSGINNLIEFYKVPLGILALIFPTVALVTANHRSELTLRQIQESQAQNDFANYYKHLEEFNKYVSGFESKFIVLEDSKLLHDKLFGHHMEFASNVSSAVVREIKLNSIVLYKVLCKINNGTSKNLCSDALSILFVLGPLTKDMGVLFRNADWDYVTVPESFCLDTPQPLFNAFKTSEQLFNSVRELAHLIELAMSFSMGKEKIPTLQAIAGMNTSQMKNVRFEYETSRPFDSQLNVKMDDCGSEGKEIEKKVGSEPGEALSEEQLLKLIKNL